MAITIKINPPSPISISAAPIVGLTGPTGATGPAGADGGGLASLVEDTSPQLGGPLDVNNRKITSASNGNIDIEPNGTGDVLLGNFKFDADQTVGSGQDNYILTYDNSTGKISLEAAAGLSNIVEDTTPQLGGGLDAQTNNITNLGSLNGTAASKIISRSITIACSDETTALTTGTAKATFRMPSAATITAVRASVTTAPAGSVLTVDINESGSTILSTKLTIDAGEKTSATAATAAVISDTSIADDAEMTIDIDGIGSSTAGAGLKVTIYYNPA